MTALVDSKHHKLSQEEIIKVAAKQPGNKYTAEQIKNSLTLEAFKLKALMMRAGNTIFIVHPSPNDAKIAIFRAVNADTSANYLHNSLVFTKAIGLAGFKVLVTQFSDKSLLNIFKYVKRHAPFPKMGYRVQRAENGDYIVTVNLGQANSGGLPDRAQPDDRGAL